MKCWPQAFDRQQQDLVEAASKSLSYRQDIMEENVRLSYALQVLFLSMNSLEFFAPDYELVSLKSILTVLLLV